MSALTRDEARALAERIDLELFESVERDAHIGVTPVLRSSFAKLLAMAKPAERPGEDPVPFSSLGDWTVPTPHVNVELRNLSPDEFESLYLTSKGWVKQDDGTWLLSDATGPIKRVAQRFAYYEQRCDDGKHANTLGRRALGFR